MQANGKGKYSDMFSIHTLEVAHKGILPKYFLILLIMHNETFYAAAVAPRLYVTSGHLLPWDWLYATEIIIFFEIKSGSLNLTPKLKFIAYNF